MDQPDEMHGGEQVLHHPTNNAPVCKTGVGARLDEAIELIKPINGSPNLAPLIREYAVMKKELGTLLALTKTYKSSTLAMDHARTKVSCKHRIWLLSCVLLTVNASTVSELT